MLILGNLIQAYFHQLGTSVADNVDTPVESQPVVPE